MDEQEYNDAVIALWESTYEDKFKALAWEITNYLRGAGYTVRDPFDLSDDSYRWAIMVEAAPDEHEFALPEPVDIWIELAESLQYGDGDQGINFSIDVTAYGGEILGGLTPYNYTPDVWVALEDEDAIGDRFSILEQADMYGFVTLLVEYAAKHKKVSA